MEDNKLQEKEVNQIPVKNSADVVSALNDSPLPLTEPEIDKPDSAYDDKEEERIYIEAMKQAKQNNEGLIYDDETNGIMKYFKKSKPTAGIDVDDFEQKVINTRKTIKDLDDFPVEQYKKWLKERNYNPRTKEEIENERLLAAAGLSISYNIKGIRTVLKSDTTGKPSVKIGRKSASIAASDITDENKIRVAVLSIKDKVKKPSIIEPSNASPEQALIFLRTATKILLDECDGKFELSDIKIPNKHYREIIMKEFEGYRVKASIGESDLEYDDNHAKATGIKQNKKETKTPDEKFAIDAAYNLFKSTEAARNVLLKSQRVLDLDFMGLKKDNIVKGINEIYAGKEVDKKFLGGKEQRQVFKNLLNSVKDFDSAMSQFETVPDNLKEAYSAVNLLKETGFNPTSKNNTAILFGLINRSNSTINNIAKNLQVVESLILKNTDMDVARLNKNDSRAVKKLNETHREIRTAIENKDLTKFSSYSSVVNSNDLNNVLKNNSGTNIFPKDTEVFKFAISGEPADIYIFRDTDGTMCEVAGSGNRYDKKVLSDISFKDASALMTAINNFGVEEIKPEVKQEIAPEIVAPDIKKEVEPEIEEIDFSATPLPEYTKGDFEDESDFIKKPETSIDDNFSAFDEDNLVEEVPVLSANELHIEEINEYLKDKTLNYDKLIKLVRVCDCCGSLECDSLIKEQLKFNNEYKEVLRVNEPSEGNLYELMEFYVGLRDKVNELSAAAKELNKVFGVPKNKEELSEDLEDPSEDLKNTSNKKTINLFKDKLK